jgi:hypothetical protein
MSYYLELEIINTLAKYNISWYNNYGNKRSKKDIMIDIFNCINNNYLSDDEKHFLSGIYYYIVSKWKEYFIGKINENNWRNSRSNKFI